MALDAYEIRTVAATTPHLDFHGSVISARSPGELRAEAESLRRQLPAWSKESINRDREDIADLEYAAREGEYRRALTNGTPGVIGGIGPEGVVLTTPTPGRVVTVAWELLWEASQQDDQELRGIYSRILDDAIKLRRLAKRGAR